MCALRASSAELDRLIHLLHCLRPVFGVTGFYGQVPELGDPIRQLLLFLERLKAVLILLGPGIVSFAERFCKVEKSL